MSSTTALFEYNTWLNVQTAQTYLQTMLKCEGLPVDGRCPQNVNNRTVKLSQGDLMLWSSCEAIRFPYIPANANANSTMQPIDTKKTQATYKKKPTSASKGTESRKNMKVAADSKGNLFDDEEDCAYCSEIVSVSTDSVRCDLCKHQSINQNTFL